MTTATQLSATTAQKNISNKDNDVPYDKHPNLGNGMLRKTTIGTENDGKGKDVD